MFNNKSIYARNKKDPDAIVYVDADGKLMRLTRADFASEKEFLQWKAWSDADYHVTEKEGHIYSDHTLSLHGLSDEAAAVQSPEAAIFEKQSEIECIQNRTILMKQFKNILTRKQFHRLWMLHVDGLTLTAIAIAEGVSEPSIFESVSSARKNIFKFLEKHPIKTPIFPR